MVLARGGAFGYPLKESFCSGYTHEIDKCSTGNYWFLALSIGLYLRNMDYEDIIILDQKRALKLELMTHVACFRQDQATATSSYSLTLNLLDDYVPPAPPGSPPYSPSRPEYSPVYTPPIMKYPY